MGSIAQADATDTHLNHAPNPEGAACKVEKEEAKPWDIGESIMHHIGNSNEFEIIPHVIIPLPCILYAPSNGFTVCLSNKFEEGTVAVDGFVLNEGRVMRVADNTFPKGEVRLGEGAIHEAGKTDDGGFTVCYGGKLYKIESGSTLFGATSFYDFSITKNVFTLLLAAILMFVIFLSMASAYKRRVGAAPKGLQNMLEVAIVFIRDEVAKPFIGHNYERYFPFILTIFFFILINNFLGLIPIFPGGANVTGNIATTFVLAIITFIYTNINGKRDYWAHIFWMPGVPVIMKIFLAPIEIIGLFAKPASLMIRLFANITAGHIIVLSLVGLIFVFGNSGQNMVGSVAGVLLAVPFTLFIDIIELVVAAIQAFIFATLAASYIGSAIEEHHH